MTEQTQNPVCCSESKAIKWQLNQVYKDIREYKIKQRWMERTFQGWIKQSN